MSNNMKKTLARVGLYVFAGLMFLSLAAVVSGCATSKNLPGIAKVVLEVPYAQSDLANYLDASERDSVRVEYGVVSDFAAKLQRVIYQEGSGVTLGQVLTRAAGTPEKVVLIERSMATLQETVELHHLRTGDEVPQSLAPYKTDGEAVGYWRDMKSDAARAVPAVRLLQAAEWMLRGPSERPQVNF